MLGLNDSFLGQIRHNNILASSIFCSQVDPPIPTRRQLMEIWTTHSLIKCNKNYNRRDPLVNFLLPKMILTSEVAKNPQVPPSIHVQLLCITCIPLTMLVSVLKLNLKRIRHGPTQKSGSLIFNFKSVANYFAKVMIGKNIQTFWNLYHGILS